MPTTKQTDEQIKIDLLNFSRTLVLKANFHNNKNIDESLIFPTSNYLPKNTPYPVLESLVNDLEALARDVKDMPRSDVIDNLSVNQRRGLNKLKSS